MSDTTSAPGSPLKPGTRVDVRAEVRRIHAGVQFFYIVDALLLGLLGALGTVSLNLGFWYALAGCTATESAFYWFRRRGSRADDLDALTLGMTTCTGLVMLTTLACAPQVGMLMLMSIMAVMALSAVQLSRRHQLMLCALLGVGIVIVLSVTEVRPGVPTANAAERTLSALWLAWLMVKASAHNITGRRLRHQVNKANAELAQALRSLEKLASTDELTLLPNRRAILANVQRAVANEPLFSGSIGVALLDIDRFKQINDTRGHDVGDHVLRDFGRVLALGLRPTDQVGRYGGEEFLLLLQECDDDAAAADVVERLCARVRAHDWSLIAPGLTVTASAGVALLMPGEDCGAAIRRADAALYEAKQRGRNRVVAAAEPSTACPSRHPPQHHQVVRSVSAQTHEAGP